MLRKLLKYDFKSVFKLWWIGAAASLLLCLIGSACITLVNSERSLPQIVNISAVIVIVFAVVGLVAFTLLSTILIYVRFYRNFFTDEGYLTFTLPVSRGQLLVSKLIMSVVTTLATAVAVFFNTGVMLSIGFAEKVFTKEFFHGLFLLIKDILDTFGIYLWVYLLEGLVLLILGLIFTHLFVFCCITLASIITKKARVITSIGVYYGANMVFTFMLQIFVLFAVEGIFERIGALEQVSQFPVCAIILFGLIAFAGMACLMIYTLQYFMLDRKLNLS